MQNQEAIRLKKQLETLERHERILKEGLPHLYGDKFYTWQRSFFDTRKQFAFLTAANQVGKSTIQIRRMIHWATEPKLWPILWPKDPTPRIFWYLYPSYDVSAVEWTQKWVPDFMPRGEFKNHPQYGWTEHETRAEGIKEVRFNTGVTIYFKSYNQDTKSLQTGTVHNIAFDEELPYHHYNELINRLNKTDGYFSGVFTPTLNQEFWYKVMEGRGDQELLQEAWKCQVSLYDCLTYEDGSPSKVWTPEKIEKVRTRCGSQTEVQRRVYGKFVTEEGRKFPAYDANKHLIGRYPLEGEWLYVGAVDPGSGGAKGHPAACCIIAVNPQFTKAYVVECWRGDGIDTSSDDILTNYRRIRGHRTMFAQVYDYQARDFSIIAGRLGEAFTPATKNQKEGTDLVNALFKNGMLKVMQDPEADKLSSELMTTMWSTDKTKAKDDLVDTVRYACMAIPWDFSSCVPTQDEDNAKIESKIMTKEDYMAEEIRQRRGDYGREKDFVQEFDEEVAFWNDLYGG